MNSWHCRGIKSPGSGFQLDLARKRVAVTRPCKMFAVFGVVATPNAIFGKAVDYSPLPEPALFLLQEALGVQRRHAAGAGAGDGLAINVVLHVAGGKHARHAGHGGKALQP